MADKQAQTDVSVSSERFHFSWSSHSLGWCSAAVGYSGGSHITELYGL